MSMVLLRVVQSMLVRISVICPVVWARSGGWVSLCILCMAVPMVIGLIVLTFSNGNQQLCYIDVWVISFVNHHGLVLRTQAIEEGILSLVFQVTWPEHVAVELFKVSLKSGPHVHSSPSPHFHFFIEWCLNLFIRVVYIVALPYT